MWAELNSLRISGWNIWTSWQFLVFRWHEKVQRDLGNLPRCEFSQSDSKMYWQRCEMHFPVDGFIRCRGCPLLLLYCSFTVLYCSWPIMFTCSVLDVLVCVTPLVRFPLFSATLFVLGDLLSSLNRFTSPWNFHQPVKAINVTFLCGDSRVSFT